MIVKMKTGPKSRPLFDRFEEKYIPVTETGCWLWDGYVKPNGYASMYVNESGTKEYAHRISYELYNGEIPEGKIIDHLCRVRSCVNPNHLEVVTHAINSQRSPIMGNPQKKYATHCIRGHLLSGENLYISPKSKKRGCRICRKNSKKT